MSDQCCGGGCCSDAAPAPTAVPVAPVAPAPGGDFFGDDHDGDELEMAARERARLARVAEHQGYLTATEEGSRVGRARAFYAAFDAAFADAAARAESAVRPPTAD